MFWRVVGRAGEILVFHTRKEFTVWAAVYGYYGWTYSVLEPNGERARYL